MDNQQIQKNEKLDTNAMVSSVAKRIATLTEEGLKLPSDYNYTNALKAAIFKIADVKDKNGNSALTICTPNSIQETLFRMCTMGLDMAKNQCYPVVYGKTLKLQESYFGKILRAKRISPDFDGRQAKVVRKGDIFETEIVNGYRKIVKHIEKMENMDNEFVCAYAIITNSQGMTDVHVMTMKQIEAAWNMSQARDRKFQKQFPEKAALRTVISSGINILLNSTPDTDNIEDVDFVDVTNKEEKSKGEYTEFEEVPPKKVSQGEKIAKEEVEPNPPF